MAIMEATAVLAEEHALDGIAKLASYSQSRTGFARSLALSCARIQDVLRCSCLPTRKPWTMRVGRMSNLLPTMLDYAEFHDMARFTLPFNNQLDDLRFLEDTSSTTRKEHTEEGKHSLY